MAVEERDLRQRLCDIEQGHVFRFWDEISAEERSTLVAQLSAIDLDELQHLIEQHLAEGTPHPTPQLSPGEVIPTPSTQPEVEDRRRAVEVGEAALRQGRVAMLVVAGGQATRLGYDAPKGTFAVTPITGKSLFCVHAERVLALRRRYGASVPLLVLVSPHNHAATLTFFEDHEFFGLPSEDVLFLEQGMLPALDRDGRLLLADRGKIFLSPDGHGGVFRAMLKSGMLDELDQRSIDTVFYFQVDNPLVKVGDPAFLGYHLAAGADLSLKVVRKRDEMEKVGIYTKVNGHPGVIEYSDLPEAVRDARDDHDNLLYWAGNIAIHTFQVDFMRRIAEGQVKLPHHMARKKVPHVDDRGTVVQPKGANGLKFEAFVFDAIPFAKKVVAVEVERSEEFAPVKNRTGEDSPKTSRAAQSDLHRAWLSDAGMPVENDDSVAEISPLFALDREELREKLQASGFSSARKVLLD